MSSTSRLLLPNLLLSATCVVLAACGGSAAGTSGSASSTSTTSTTSGGSTSTSGSGSTSSTGSSSSSSGGTSGSSSGTSSGSSSSGASGSSGSSGGSGGSSSSSSSSTTGPAAQLAAKLGTPSHLLIGLGGQSDTDADAAIRSQSLNISIYERYLVGSWPTWNSNPDYVGVVTQAADSFSAVPMFTLYQMADNGEDNMSALQDSTFMTSYWSRVKQLFQDLGSYGKPALVNLEPDFWGYTELNATSGNPTSIAALVSSNADCSTLPNNVKGIAQCLLAMGRKYAPKAYIGFPPSSWGGSSEADVVTWMNALGAQNADFIVEQTLDRDAGCFEVSPQPSYCSRSGSGWYWDETNTTHPNFHDYLALVQQDHVGIGNLPVIWWQTPEGVPSSTPGGTAYHYRDNREHYFLTHPAELTAVGGLAVVFGNGASDQTSIVTDGGQFKALSGAYLATPAALP